MTTQSNTEKFNIIESKNIQLKFKNSTSPVLIHDNSDKDSFYVIMPMKI